MEDYSYYLDNKIDKDYFISDVLKESINKNIVLACIGTDKVIGDSFGPLCGTLINEKNLENIIVYGTLEEPIHGLNAEEKGKEIMDKHKDDFVIAIDSCIGNDEYLKKVYYQKKPINPGKGSGKNISPIGHVSIKYVLGNEYRSLFLTHHRIGDVYKAVKEFVSIIEEIDQIITQEKETIDEVSFDLHRRK